MSELNLDHMPLRRQYEQAQTRLTEYKDSRPHEETQHQTSKSGGIQHHPGRAHTNILHTGVGDVLRTNSKDV